MVQTITNLLNGLESATVEAVVSAATATSPAAQDAIKNELTDNVIKFKKLSKTQRPAAIQKVIAKMAEAYPVSLIEDATTATATTADEKPADATKKPSWKAMSKHVYQYDKDGNLVGEHSSIQAAHRATGISDSSICYCCNKKVGFKTAGGYQWSYEPISLAE